MRGCPNGRTSSRAFPAAATGRRLLFLSHTDVVLADAAEWSADPFGGELRDGEVWGRGALDMKGQVAASAVAIASLAREGFRAGGRPDLRRDRRRGGRCGLRRAVAVRGASGRGALRLPDQRRLGRPARARRQAVLHLLRRREDERAVPPARARTERSRVDAGHRRQRAREGGAADHSARRVRPRAQAHARGRGAARGGDRREAGRRRRRRSNRRARIGQSFAEMVEPLLVDDARADDDHRVAEAERHPGRLRRDRRLPPAAGDDDRRSSRRSCAGCWATATTSSRCSRRTAGRARRSRRRCGMRSLRWVQRGRARGAEPAPICVAGFTDSHWFREAFGTVAYGFFPLARDGRGAGGPADPLCGRARAGRGPRARRELPRATPPTAMLV